MLLDNTGGAGGTRFLETLAECRAEMPHDADPLVIVAGHDARPEGDLGSGPLAEARVQVGDRADATIYGPGYVDWQAQALDLPDQPLWYRVRLADLDAHGLRRMVTTRELDGMRGHDADFIHDLTGGHLGTAATLAAALKDSQAGHLDLLSGHDQLLRALVPDDPDDAMLTAMAIGAVTPGSALVACNAVFKFLRISGVTAQDVHDRLTAAMWAAGHGGGLDLHPLVRRLLVRRLADDPALWRQVHDGYQAYYATARDETCSWYHKLASEQPGQAGELGKLVQRMDARVGEISPDQWCGELDSITSAPNMLRPRGIPPKTGGGRDDEPAAPHGRGDLADGATAGLDRHAMAVEGTPRDGQGARGHGGRRRHLVGRKRDRDRSRHLPTAESALGAPQRSQVDERCLPVPGQDGSRSRLPRPRSGDALQPGGEPGHQEDGNRGSQSCVESCCAAGCCEERGGHAAGAGAQPESA